MSQLQNKIIKYVQLKQKPWGQQGYYSHRVTFEDGSKGEIYHCMEPNPDWLKEGKNLAFIIKPSNFPDTPFIVTIDSMEQEKEHTQTEVYTPPASQANQNRFQKRGGNNSYGGYKGYGRYEDSPLIWLKKQKFICMLKLYEVLVPVIVKGDIKYEDLTKEVDKHLDHIIKKSEMDSLPPIIHNNNNTPSSFQTAKAPVQQFKKPITSTQTSKGELNELHTSREAEPTPDVSPEAYCTVAELPLFEQDKNMSNDPIPKDLAEKIKKCDTNSKLTKLQRVLTSEQVNNKNIMNAFFEQKKSIAKNRKAK